ncbi:prothoracicostatic peptide [Aplysia californica]|uniref:Prothoracicostatic peptide n=1 Tax=Aplysia californica TaxID=6500 RepID=A0ABM0JUH3_APLCA|nr:prothoracicostatic peptide [Aplysia californica]
MKQVAILLLVLPAVFGGQFMAMWEDMEKEMKEKGWGDKGKAWGGEGEDKAWGGMEEKKDWGEKKPWGDMKEWEDNMKQWGEKKPWGEKQQWGDMKEWEDKMKQWGEQKPWGEKKPWGDMKEWEDKMKQWGEQKPSGEKKEGGEGEKEDMYAQFKEWLKGQEEHSKEKEEREEYMKNAMMKFKEYMQMKHFKEMQEKEAKMAMYQQMEKIKMKKMLTDKLYSMSQEFMEGKLKFMFGISAHFLEFCQCDSSKDIFMRIKEGRYGGEEMAGMGNMPQMNNVSFSGNSTGGMTFGQHDANMTDPSSMEEFVAWFAHIDHKEQAKHVLHDLVKVMCSSAKQYLAHMKEVEQAVIAYKRNNGM